MKKSIYVLGTHTSHNGSACLLKDGKIVVAIEKERITRVKHEGGNDNDAINYCLQAEGITLKDVDLIVQNANYGNFKFGNDFYEGPRLFTNDLDIPIVTVSHHLAHAYSTIGTTRFDNFNILVMDGCGSPYEECMDLTGAFVPDTERMQSLSHLFFEKDSYYKFEDNKLTPVIKDFSEWGHRLQRYPMHPNSTKHSIGGLYGAASVYCFGNTDDPGKLMGLGPYGRPGFFNEEIFELRDGRVFVKYDWLDRYDRPARSYTHFKENFQYYADIAYGIQKQLEKAVLYIVNSRLETLPCENLCYAGGTALNAVANARILAETNIANIYMTPAAADNGIALGCAYYGWLEVLKKERVKHNGSTCFGVTYADEQIEQVLESYNSTSDVLVVSKVIDSFFQLLNKEYDETIRDNRQTLLQFNIEGIGVYQIMINKGVKAGKEIMALPTCQIHITGADMYKGILSPEYLQELVNTGGMTISSEEDFGILLSYVDFDLIEEALTLSMRNEEDNSGKLHYIKSDNYLELTAKLLSQGKVIGWFQDGCEFGPRALGRRSILADPRNEKVRDFINAEIKFREDFRPFAPSVLREDVSLYFKTDRESPYMILVDPVREEWHQKIKSVVHENNTCRIQTVTPDWSPKYYALLQEFKKISGISVLLNTSFNRRGMPIVETPGQALEFFFACKIDFLVMGNFIVGKSALDFAEIEFEEEVENIINLPIIS